MSSTQGKQAKWLFQEVSYCTIWVLRDFDTSDSGVSTDENASFEDGWGYKAIRRPNIQRGY